MDVQQQKKSLEKKRSIYLRLFLLTLVIGAPLLGYGGLQEIALYQNIGAAFFSMSIIFFIFAYKTGKKYINL